MGSYNSLHSCEFSLSKHCSWWSKQHHHPDDGAADLSSAAPSRPQTLQKSSCHVVSWCVSSNQSCGKSLSRRFRRWMVSCHCACACEMSSCRSGGRPCYRWSTCTASLHYASTYGSCSSLKKRKKTSRAMVDLNKRKMANRKKTVIDVDNCVLVLLVKKLIPMKIIAFSP